MNLPDFLKTVEQSDPSDWQKKQIQTVYGWNYGDDWCVPNTCAELCVYKPDIDVTLAFAATVNEDFSEPWVTKFPNPHASSVAVVFRYRGAPVYELVGVVVDGGRYLLPMPAAKGNGQYEVPRDKMPMAELLFQLSGVGGVHTSAADALRGAGVPIV